MVGVARIELATPAMSTQCSTTELYAHAARAFSRAIDSHQGLNLTRRRFAVKQPLNLKHQILQVEGL
jgi:hypothetical protein